MVNLQVTDATDKTVELRAIMSAANAGRFEPARDVREKLIDFLQREHPEALPRQRSEAAAAGVPVSKTDVEKRKMERKAASGG